MIIQVGEKIARVPEKSVRNIETTCRSVIGVYGNTPKVRGLVHRIEKRLLENLIAEYSK